MPSGLSVTQMILDSVRLIALADTGAYQKQVLPKRDVGGK